MPKTPAPDLTPDQRLSQIATIFAQAVIRNQRRGRCGSPIAAKKLPLSGPGGLEVPGETRLSVSRCVGG